MLSASSSSRVNWALFARPAVGATSLVLAIVLVLAAWQFALPRSAPTVFPFSETYYLKAVDSAAAGKLPQALAWAKKATDAGPARAENWVLLAYVYENIDRNISPRVITAMRRSYDVAPLAYEAHNFRLTQMFGNWSRFPNDLHKLAFQEARVYIARSEGDHNLSALVPTLNDPQGRIALAIIVLESNTQRRIAYRLQMRPKNSNR